MSRTLSPSTHPNLRLLVHRRNFNRRPDVTSTDGRVDGGCAIHRDGFNLPGLFSP